MAALIPDKTDVKTGNVNGKWTFPTEGQYTGIRNSANKHTTEFQTTQRETKHKEAGETIQQFPLEVSTSYSSQLTNSQIEHHHQHTFRKPSAQGFPQ